MVPIKQVERAVGEAGPQRILLLRRPQPREHADRDAVRAEPRGEAAAVLLGEHGGGREQHGLVAPAGDAIPGAPPRADHAEDRPGRDLGLAEADVAAHQPVHRCLRLQVGGDGGEGLGLVGGRLVREVVLERAEPVGLGRVRPPRPVRGLGRRFPLLPHEGVRGGLGEGQLLRPGEAVERVGRGGVRGRVEGEHAGGLVGGHAEGVGLGEGEREVIQRGAAAADASLDRLHAPEQGDAVVGVDERIAGLQRDEHGAQRSGLGRAVGGGVLDGGLGRRRHAEQLVAGHDLGVAVFAPQAEALGEHAPQQPGVGGVGEAFVQPRVVGVVADDEHGVRAAACGQLLRGGVGVSGEGNRQLGPEGGRVVALGVHFHADDRAGREALLQLTGGEVAGTALGASAQPGGLEGDRLGVVEHHAGVGGQEVEQAAGRLPLQHALRLGRRERERGQRPVPGLGRRIGEADRPDAVVLERDHDRRPGGGGGAAGVVRGDRSERAEADGRSVHVERAGRFRVRSGGAVAGGGQEVPECSRVQLVAGVDPADGAGHGLRTRHGLEQRRHRGDHHPAARVRGQVLRVRTAGGAVVERRRQHQPPRQRAFRPGAQQVSRPERVEGRHHQVRVAISPSARFVAPAGEVQEVRRGRVGLVLEGRHQQHRPGVREGRGRGEQRRGDAGGSGDRHGGG